MGKLLTEGEAFLKFLVYGKSGTGKTSLGVTAPKPMFLLSERQGYRSVRKAARRLGVPVPPTVYCETLDDLRNALRVLRVGGDNAIPRVLREVLGEGEELDKALSELPYTEPQTIVGDSLTDFYRLVHEDVIQSLGFPKSTKDGQEIRHDRYWDLLRSRSEGLMYTFRDLPYHALMLCLLDDRMLGKKDEEKQRWVGPDTPMRNLAPRLVAITNACGMTMKQSIPKAVSGDQVEYDQAYKVRFVAADFVVTKCIEPLEEVEVPDFSDWVMRILADDELGTAEEVEAAAATQEAAVAAAPAMPAEGPKRAHRAQTGAAS